MGTTSAPPAPASAAAPEGHGSGLHRNVITASGSVVMAVAGSAPAYSIAATTATLVAAAGLASPAALLWCGIPMLGIAWAFSYLGRADVNAGASYSWVGRALHPTLGYLSGWALVVSATIFMVAGSLPAGSVTVDLFSPSHDSETWLVTLIGSVWFLVMVTCVMIGIRVTAHAQWIMSSIEVAILIIFAVIAIVRASLGHHAGPAFSWSWLGFGHFNGMSGFVAAALVAAFYYWGWDVSANLNEETKDSHKAAGLGGIIGVLIVFALFEMFTIAINMMMTPASIAANSGNVLGRLGEVIWPGAGGKLLIIAVMLSTIATLETTLIQVTRSLFAMGRDHTLPAAFGRVHSSWRTPAFATVVVAGVSLVLFIGSNFLGSVGTILSDAISSIGLQIAFYYALAGLAVVVAYRRQILTSPKNFLFIGLWPAVGAAFMTWIFIESIPTLGLTIDLIGLGTLAVGIIPMCIYWAKGSSYFVRVPLTTGSGPAPAESPEPRQG
ncbi:APC family permease [Leekyejoonella antrihumi]|uniref:APC family permease n=1 Tax=Leekyejoonella antrihumi TaxID=1660198 RepID=A0A563E3R6_9MICO|nr:APC family permease [Leekyejoonella antrihumi]TWP37166.1 APC family permease [Leekyejoonella antrihumi]